MTEAVYLTRIPEDIPLDSLDWSLETWITVRLDGKPLPMTRDYYEDLRRHGWQGVEQIPEECIVERP